MEDELAESEEAEDELDGVELGIEGDTNAD
jgi:hypothetical protein